MESRRDTKRPICEKCRLGYARSATRLTPANLFPSSVHMCGHLKSMSGDGGTPPLNRLEADTWRIAMPVSINNSPSEGWVFDARALGIPLGPYAFYRPSKKWPKGIPLKLKCTTQ